MSKRTSVTLRVRVAPLVAGLVEASIVGRKPFATEDTTVLGTCSASRTSLEIEGSVTLLARALDSTKSRV